MSSRRVYCEGRRMQVPGLTGTLVCKGIEIAHDGSEQPDSAPIESTVRGLEQTEVASRDTSLNLATMQLLLDFGVQQLESQVASCRQMDTKMGVVLGFALVVLAQGLAAAVRIPLETVAVLRTHAWQFYTIVDLLIILFLASVCTVGFGLWALEPRTVKVFSVVDHLNKTNHSPLKILPELNAVEKGVHANRAVQASKVSRSRLAVVSIAVVFVCYVLIGCLLLFGLAR